MSIVVCTYTEARLDDLERCLEGVAGQTRPADQVLVVVDHCEPLEQRLAGRTETVIANEGRRGLSAARNTGLTHATGSIVVFLDDDASPAPTWLEELVAPFADPTVVAVGGRIEPGWPTDRPWWFPNHLDWTVGCSIPSMPEAGGDIRNVFGASAAFRRDPLRLVGGFTEALGRTGADAAGCEETDVCIRLRAGRPGDRVVYAPDSVVVHRVTDDRATVAYVLRRCLAEGRSKAVLSARVGSQDAMSVERSYVLMMAAAVGRDVAGSVRRPRRLGRAAVLTAGTAAAAIGYARVRLTSLRRHPVADPEGALVG